jgi:tRNA(Ile)-lysidine synthase
MKIEREFERFIHSNQSDLFFIACSGGLDSMVLLHLAKKLNLVIEILHVNYNLRGEESLSDVHFLKQYASKNQISISILEVDLKKELELNGGNLQNEARRIRYNFFGEKLNNTDKSKLLIAHHQDDQIETFWLQLFRGSGLKGMAGMDKINSRIIRPLLNVSKSELVNYALKNQIFWREDQSNAQLNYQRNLWRNKYIPFLNSQIPTINNSVLKLQEVFSSNLLEISKKINQVRNQIIQTNYVEFKAISQFQSVEIVELFRTLNIPLNQIQPWIKLLKSQKGSKVKWESSEGKFTEIIREEKGFSFVLNDNKVIIPTLNVRQVERLPEKFEKNIFYFDPNKIDGQLKIRFWKKADRIYPIGMKGSKLISDVVKDAKIPNVDRYHQTVICDDSKILSCVGLCVDRRAIASDKSTIIEVSLAY